MQSFIKENELAVLEQLDFVMGPSVICKCAMMNHVTIGQIKDGPIGQHGDHAQNHVVVAPESDAEHAKLLITSAVMKTSQIITWPLAMKMLAQQIIVLKKLKSILIKRISILKNSGDTVDSIIVLKITPSIRPAVHT